MRRQRRVVPLGAPKNRLVGRGNPVCEMVKGEEVGIAPRVAPWRHITKLAALDEVLRFDADKPLPTVFGNENAHEHYAPAFPEIGVTSAAFSRFSGSVAT